LVRPYAAQPLTSVAAIIGAPVAMTLLVELRDAQPQDISVVLPSERAARHEGSLKISWLLLK
jgi:hypothetical protein